MTRARADYECDPGNQYQGYQQPQGQQQYYQQQPQQFQQPPTIAKPPSQQQAAASDAAPKPAAQPKAKVLSIGVPAAPKEETKDDAPAPAAPKAKVLSIGVPAAPKKETKEEDSQDLPSKSDVGAKAVATKAVEKTNKDGGDSNASSAPGSGRSSPQRAGAKPTAKIDIVEKEQTADVDDETLKELYGKEHVNIVSNRNRAMPLAL